jgi:hypothetical protein
LGIANSLDNPERWRLRAEEMRKLAGGVNDPEAKQLILELASSYEKPAKRAAERRC